MLDYPYSLDPETEDVFLHELSSVLDVALWRAAQIEQCIREVTRSGFLENLQIDPPYFGHSVSGATRILGAIEGFLAAFARASLIIYPSRRAHLARGRHLRAVLGRDRRVTDIFNNRDLRDGWMHLDEDIGHIAVERSVAPTSVMTGGPDRWSAEALRGVVRVVDARELTVALPRRGIWSLRPYFHDCQELRQDVSVVLTNPYRWQAVGDIRGRAVGWTGREETWMIKALTRGCPVTVTASSYRDAVAAFESAVSVWLASGRAG